MGLCSRPASGIRAPIQPSEAALPCLPSRPSSPAPVFLSTLLTVHPYIAAHRAPHLRLVENFFLFRRQLFFLPIHEQVHIDAPLTPSACVNLVLAFAIASTLSLNLDMKTQ